MINAKVFSNKEISSPIKFIIHFLVRLQYGKYGEERANYQ